MKAFGSRVVLACAVLLGVSARLRAETIEETATASQAFALGAQTEIRTGAAGVPSLLVGWEGGTYQIEAGFGVDGVRQPLVAGPLRPRPAPVPSSASRVGAAGFVYDFR